MFNSKKVKEEASGNQLLVRFFENKQFQNSEYTPEELTIREWDEINADYTVNRMCFTGTFYQQNLHALYHNPSLQFFPAIRLQQGIDWFKGFLVSAHIHEPILRDFIAANAHQDSFFSILRPFADFIDLRNINSACAVSLYRWTQLSRTFHVLNNTDCDFPAIDIRISFMLQKKLISFDAMPIEPDLSSEYREQLRSQYPEFIGTYTLIIVNNAAQVINPSYEIPLRAPDSPSLQTDFEAYLRELQSSSSTPSLCTTPPGSPSRYMTPLSTPLGTPLGTPKPASWSPAKAGMPGTPTRMFFHT